MAEAPKTAESTSTPQDEARKEEKAKKIWTLEKCKKIAKRFSSRDEWKTGAPASYKSAVSHKWDQECCQLMKPAPQARPSTKAKAPSKTRKSA